jgi:hypothetical protein
MNEVNIRIAGNTEAPCFFVIKSLGYSVEIYCNELTDNGEEYIWTYEARKDKNFFSATTIQELLGIIILGEKRGSQWRATSKEIEEYFSFRDKAAIYDVNGNQITE